MPSRLTWVSHVVGTALNKDVKALIFKAEVQSYPTAERKDQEVDG